MVSLWPVVKRWLSRISGQLSYSVPQLDENTIPDLIKEAESENIEFKQKLLPYEKISEYVVGIGNAGGGLLLFGVTDKKPRQLLGIPTPSESELKQIQTSVYNSTGIRVRLQPLLTKDGLFVLGVGIPSRARGSVFCTQNGKYLIRVGESLVGMAPQEVSRLLQERPPVRFRLVTVASIAAVLLVAFILIFPRNRKTLTDRESILLADTANVTGDAIFGDTIKQALAVKLQESPFLSFVPESRIREELLAMRRPAGEPLTVPVAIEVCAREGGRAVVAGSVAPLGKHYVIAANAADCRTGDVFVREQVEADSAETVLTAMNVLSRNLRRSLGESLASMQNFDTPLEKATTSSLSALRNYSLGNKQLALGSNEEAIRLFERAINDDANFAMAYAKMGVAYDNL